MLDVDSERAGNPDCRFEAIRTTTQPIGPIAKVVERVQCHPVRIEARGQGVGTVGLETVMNQMPQFVPAVTPFTTTDVQASATNTPGASTLSLRGLGANRNLVLIDGRRGMPVNALGAISINSIPSAAVARVETITGGASSVYGADAMAGVVNFATGRAPEIAARAGEPKSPL